MSLFGRFTGTRKPVEQKEDVPFDSTKLHGHMDDLNKKEEEISHKIQEIDREIGEYLWCLNSLWNRLKEQMKNRGPNYRYLHEKALTVF